MNSGDKESVPFSGVEAHYHPVLAFPGFEVLSTAETNASSISPGAVLAQKKAGGKVRPLQFAT